MCPSLEANVAAQKKSLRSKTFALFFVFSLAVAVAAIVAVTAASFSSYEAEAERILLSQSQAYAELLNKDADQSAMCNTLGQLPLVDTRATLVADDGTVLYDNYADPATLGNHADREEIAAAKVSGQTATLRRSETLGTDTLYAASLVRSGIVLRLAETRTSLASFLAGMALPLGVSLLAILLLSFLISRALTNMIVRPFEKIDLTHPLENDAYKELQPLLTRVDAQRLELEKQNQELAHSVELRREFTGNVSHEMKTPLQVIGGYAELMEQGMVSSEEIPQISALIRSEAASMRELIDDVLTLSRLDEHVSVDGVEVSLPSLCRHVCERLSAAAAERDERMVLQLPTEGSPDEQSAAIQGDPQLAEQMIYNLVDNAIRYNIDGGMVRIRLQVRDDCLWLSVADEGPGVPEELRERIFERFYRVDASRSRETGGTGLGLAIVKHAAEQLGGSVSVGTADLGGAEFTVMLPR